MLIMGKKMVQNSLKYHYPQVTTLDVLLLPCQLSSYENTHTHTHIHTFRELCTVLHMRSPYYNCWVPCFSSIKELSLSLCQLV